MCSLEGRREPLEEWVDVGRDYMTDLDRVQGLDRVQELDRDLGGVLGWELDRGQEQGLDRVQG